MNKNHKTLELDLILEKLAAECSCDDAKDLARGLKPAGDMAEVEMLLQQTEDAFSLLARFGGPSFSGLKNVNNSLHRAAAGGSLNPKELLDIAYCLRALRTLDEWRNHSSGVKTSLDFFFEGITSNKYLETKILSCIVSEEEIADKASDTLFDIRKKIRSKENSIREKLDSLIHSSHYQQFLQEAIITQRNGRFVVPVKAECRGNVPGLVHDTSSTGATVFIEPASVVDANNDIKVLQGKERDEIMRILYELSAESGDFAESIKHSYESAIRLNLIFAKAHLAYKMKATKPILNNEGIICLKKARHPLIDPKKVVATDIALGDEYDTLVITGPNTGGKTVSLKTLGLLTLMTMCGLLIPVADRSRVSVFNNILVDIGDEQSIEQSLSTFSGHMKRITGILELAGPDTLTLIDELGAGTDPAEGAALAVSILERLRKQGTLLMATTHYAELKIYALETPGVVNASCEFDVESLAPTYKLSVGVPGKSNAFLISAKLGIPESVIDAARNHMSNDDKRLDSVLAQLDDLKLQLKAAEDEAEKARYEAEHALESAEKKRDALIKQGEEELEATRRKAHELMQGVQNQAYALTDELRRIQKDEKTNAAARAVRAREIARKDTEQLLNRTEKKQPKRQFVPLKEVKPGQEVVIAELDQHAVVLSRPDKNGMVEVRAGILKTKVPLTGLCAPDKMDKRTQKQEPPRTRTHVELNHDRKSSMELNLLGYTVEEALAEVDRFLDHAMLSNQNTVYIIHGNGTGALRNAIQKHLRTHRGVKSFRLGRYGEGESGVTVVELK